MVCSPAKVNRSPAGVSLNPQPSHLQLLKGSSEEITRALEFDLMVSS
jgi:hypothetical protein